jgi:hypothetical protein
MPSFPLEGQDRGADQLLEHTTWCRKVVKMASSDQKMVVLLASFRMLGPIRYPFVTADVLGHFIPMLLPLVEDYRASIQWIGNSVLDCLLRACVSTSLVPYKPMLSEVRLWYCNVGMRCRILKVFRADFAKRNSVYRSHGAWDCVFVSGVLPVCGCWCTTSRRI